MKRLSKTKIGMIATFFFGVTLAYFVWLIWNKLTEMIGDSDKVLIITGIVVLLGLITGYLSIKKIAEQISG